jgi:hypothetical protein
MNEYDELYLAICESNSLYEDMVASLTEEINEEIIAQLIAETHQKTINNITQK